MSILTCVECTSTSFHRTSRLARWPKGEDVPACACAKRSRTTSGRATRALPASASDDLRRYLPGVEPERQLNDWGRSERVEGIYDRYLLDFYYRYWFRCDVEGVENVPPTAARCSSRTTPARCRPTRR